MGLRIAMMIRGKEYRGFVIKHDHDYCQGSCLVEFYDPVDLHLFGYRNKYHVVPFAKLRRLPTPEGELS